MKKILIVIYDMRIGGAQKSLLSFLSALAADARCMDYEIDLMPFNPTGEFLAQVPPQINIRRPDNVLRWMGTHVSKELFFRHFSLRGFIGEAMWVLSRKLGLLPGKGNVQQKLWHVWRRVVPQLEKTYDAAISYIDGMANYYVIDKVKADKKVLWLHSDYHKQGYDADFDRRYYSVCDAAITVSAQCREGLCRALPECESRIHELANISSGEMVLSRSLEGECPEYAREGALKLLTVGRLNPQKGMDLAVEAAKCLKEAGVCFEWLVLGDGDERRRLEAQILDAGVDDCFHLLGSKDNPYVYMRKCDILVQPSRIEGKSIVLDEAKILNKPAVVTRYPTAKDAIEHEETGLIVDMNGEAIARGVQRMAGDDALRNRIVENISRLPKGNEAELQRYIDLML